MTRIIIILAFLAALVQTDCMAQHLFGVNGYYSMNSIALDSMGMKRKIFAEPGYGGGFVYKHMELSNLIGFQAEVNYDYVGFPSSPPTPRITSSTSNMSPCRSWRMSTSANIR